jgi:predicted amidophosphoribosyltransferase
MKVNLRTLCGNWDQGYALDKHMLSSEFFGYNEQGHPQFNSVRTEVGEATFQLKYRQDWLQAPLLAQAIAEHITPKLQSVGLLIPMAASTSRQRQPVTEVAQDLGKLLGIHVLENLLLRASGGTSLKDLRTKAEKIAALTEAGFSVGGVDVIDGVGPWNALVIDDLYHTGASLEAACAVLKTHPKINKIYVAALTMR